MNNPFPRCQILPQPGEQVSFQVDGAERLRWHFGSNYPRPFFFPLVGPSRATLTRMGHPGAPNHDHHRSLWFAHAKVLGIDFWSDNTAARIRQKQWRCYQDGDQEAAMAVSLGWYDGHDPQDLLEQEVIAMVRPAADGELFLELQSTFLPRAESLEFGQTNFGFLAVRVAKSLSAYFGGGQIFSSEGGKGEPAIFGKPARWMDYSGPTPGEATEGIAYFDHPENPGYPVCWHVREDGWMGAAPCLSKPLSTSRQQPLVLRYLLYAHRGTLDVDRGDAIAREFGESPPAETAKAGIKHVEYAIRRRKRV
jgi:methane monooxygenase PmoA-like